MWFVAHHLPVTAPLFIQNENLRIKQQRLNEQEVKSLILHPESSIVSSQNDKHISSYPLRQ